MASDPAKTYLWCSHCRRSFSHHDAPDALCPVCSLELASMGKFAAIVRGLMSQELAAPEIKTKHRQLIRLIWTRNGMGERYYNVLNPDLPYNRFEARVTDLLCRGAEEGWVRFIMPPAPSQDEGNYRLEFVDEDRFVAELHDLAESTRTKT